MTEIRWSWIGQKIIRVKPCRCSFREERYGTYLDHSYCMINPDGEPLDVSLNEVVLVDLLPDGTLYVRPTHYDKNDSPHELPPYWNDGNWVISSKPVDPYTAFIRDNPDVLEIV